MTKTLKANLLSVIVRFHDPLKLSVLEEALDSLWTQHYQPLEVCLILQNFTSDQELQIKQLVASRNSKANSKPPRTSSPPPPVKLLNLPTPPGQDSRALLLNEGLALAEGQYLAFLDYDDIILSTGYALLIQQAQQAQNSVAAVIVGGCTVTTAAPSTGPSRSTWTANKAFDFYSWGTGTIDLIWNNFIPIHSFIIDRCKFARDPLKPFTLLSDDSILFDISLTRCEDYDFLLKLASRYEFDFTHLRTPVCEYRFRNDGSNTTVLPLSPTAAVQPWNTAIQVLNQRKKSLSARINMYELFELREQLNQATAQRRAFESELNKIEHVMARRIRQFLKGIPFLKLLLQKSRQLLKS